MSRFTNDQEFIAEALALRTYYHTKPNVLETVATVPSHIKCCAFDMDGTLCTLQNVVTPATEAAIRAFGANGGTVKSECLVVANLLRLARVKARKHGSCFNAEILDAVWVGGHCYGEKCCWCHRSSR